MAMQELGWWEDGYGLFAALLSLPSNYRGAKNNQERSPTVCLIPHLVPLFRTLHPLWPPCSPTRSRT